MISRRALWLALCLVGGLIPAHAGVRLLAHYNASAEADAGAVRTAVVNGAAVTTGRQGYPFPYSKPAPEALDLGYAAAPQPDAAVTYDAANVDVRQGTVQMLVKTSWDWDNPAQERVNRDRFFLSLPLTGGIHNSINLYFACGQGFNYRPHLAFYIHDGQRDYMCCVPVDPQAATDFDWHKDRWHYIVATWTPRQMTLWVDGKKLAVRDFEIPMSLTTPHGPLVIGNQARDRTHPAAALVDELRLLDLPLQDADSEFAVPALELAETIQGTSFAAAGPATAFRPEPRRCFAYRAAAPPAIDGVLGDPAWRAAPAVGGVISYLLIDTVPVAMSRLRGILRTCQPPDLSFPQVRALAFIHRNRGVSLSAVAEHSSLSLSAVSKLVEDMVGKGYVIHGLCPSDRRRASLQATEHGRAVIQSAIDMARVALTDLFVHLDETALAAHTAGLQELDAVFTRT